MSPFCGTPFWVKHYLILVQYSEKLIRLLCLLYKHILRMELKWIIFVHIYC